MDERSLFRNPVLYPPDLRGTRDVLCCSRCHLLPSFAKTGQTAMSFFNRGKFGFLAQTILIEWPAPQARVLPIASLVSLFAGTVSILTACSSASPRLSIKMYHPETKQTLTCAASDQLSQANSSALASAVETCARHLEGQGFVREK